MPRKPRVPRHTLSRETIAAAALDHMDAEGVPALTVRALASRLGVAPMALYNHVATKEDILDAARDHGLVQLPAADPGPGVPWWTRLREINLAFHRALRRHPSLVTLLAARPLAGGVGMAVAEAQLQVLREAGFPPAVAAQAHLMLLQYAIGSAVWSAPRGDREHLHRALAGLPADRYPTMTTLAAELAEGSTESNTFGLDLLLTALRQSQ